MTIPMAQKGWCDHTLQLLYFHEEWLFFRRFLSFVKTFWNKAVYQWWFNTTQQSPYQRHTVNTYKRNFAMRRVSRNTCILYHVYKCNTPSSISSNYQMPFENTIRIRLRRLFFFGWEFTCTTKVSSFKEDPISKVGVCSPWCSRDLKQILYRKYWLRPVGYYYYTRWWQLKLFLEIFKPDFFPIWRAYFSDGWQKPLTSVLYCLCHLW